MHIWALVKTHLEPGSGLRSRLQGITVSTVGIVAGRGSVRGTVTFTTGLDPDEGILESIAGIGGRADTETSADDVAPVTPGILLGGLDTVAG